MGHAVVNQGAIVFSTPKRFCYRNKGSPNKECSVITTYVAGINPTMAAI